MSKVIITITRSEDTNGFVSVTSKRDDEQSKLYSLSQVGIDGKWSLVTGGNYIASYGRVCKAIEKIFILS